MDNAKSPVELRDNPGHSDLQALISEAPFEILAKIFLEFRDLALEESPPSLRTFMTVSQRAAKRATLRCEYGYTESTRRHPALAPRASPSAPPPSTSASAIPTSIFSASSWAFPSSLTHWSFAITRHPPPFQ
ncbi:hypothetical protein C8R45DRAFT_938699 [Mycena sanguinolenta]|nr:hypothetical protein C8R45DRAFT_938699 [Mycena sanguinolenta]